MKERLTFRSTGARAVSIHSIRRAVLVDKELATVMGIENATSGDTSVARYSGVKRTKRLSKSSTGCVDCSHLIDPSLYLPSFIRLLISSYSISSVDFLLLNGAVGGGTLSGIDCRAVETGREPDVGLVSDRCANCRRS